MTNNMEINDFENLLVLKSQLITLSLEKIKEQYTDVSSYILFVDTVGCMLNEESAFLYLSETFPKKIKEILQIHRFDIENSEVVEAINDITIDLNNIENASIDYRKMILTNYIEYQKDIRHFDFDTFEDFFNALAYDALVFLNLKGVITIPNINNDLLLSSIGYIIESCPDFFKNRNIYDLAYYALDELSLESNIFDFNTKILTTQRKKELKNIRLKEE